MNKLYISMYHYTRNLRKSRYPEIKGLDEELFVKQLDFFKENFNTVTMEEVIGAVKHEKKLPERALLLTFDDGYIDNYTIALPLLLERGMQGSFFIPAKPLVNDGLLEVNKIHFIIANGNDKSLVEDILKYLSGLDSSPLKAIGITDKNKTKAIYNQYAISNGRDTIDTSFVKLMLQVVLPAEIRTELIDILFKKYVAVPEEVLANELYLSKPQLKTMKKFGMFIGVHGYEHNHLSELALEEQKKDIDLALDIMKEFIDIKVWVMNYPYGSYNKETLDYIKSRGAVIGLTTKRGIADIGGGSALELARFDCNDFPPKSENYRKYIM